MDRKITYSHTPGKRLQPSIGTLSWPVCSLPLLFAVPLTFFTIFSAQSIFVLVKCTSWSKVWPFSMPPALNFARVFLSSAGHRYLPSWAIALSLPWVLRSRFIFQTTLFVHFLWLASALCRHGFAWALARRAPLARTSPWRVPQPAISLWLPDMYIAIVMYFITILYTF